MKRNVVRFCAVMTFFALGFMFCGTAYADAKLATIMAGGTWVSDPRCITFGEYNGRELKWRVLEVKDGIALLLLDDILREADGTVEKMRFDAASNNFPLSELAIFLNTTFLASLSDYQSGILRVKYGPDPDNGISLWDGVPAEGSSQVFLLSQREAGNPGYFRDGTDRLADAESVLTVTGFWLRSPGSFDDVSAVVGSGGGGDNYRNVYLTYPVRPALKIDLSSSVFTSDQVTAGR